MIDQVKFLMLLAKVHFTRNENDKAVGTLLQAKDEQAKYCFGKFI